ncbi:MAG: transposase family protein [Streptosporangiaceae bacterium]
MTVYQGTSFTPELTPAGYALSRAGIKVGAGTCEDLAGSLRRRHQRTGTRWRLLSPLAQAALVIAFLRANLTYAELAAGSGISPSTCWRDVAEGISALADRGRRISLAGVARLAVTTGWDYLIVDGARVPAVTSGRETGRQRAHCSGKRKRHGLNVQTVCSPAGELLRAAAPTPGAAVDVTAARKAGIAAMLTSVIGVSADLGHLGWDKDVITGRRKPRGKELTAAQRAANRLQAQLRCAGERGNARLTYWKVLATELRCRPGRCTAMVRAVLALHYMEHDPFAALRAA